MLKDDSLGLGAKRNQGDECTGLDALQDLLSRLNGKSDEALGEEQKKREDLKINKYLHRKLGTVNFVYGGLLVGDKVQELADSMKDKQQGAAQVPGGSSEETSGDSSEADKKKEKKSKKRKAEEAEGVQSESRKEKKSKKSKSDDADEDSKSKRKEKKDKKRRKEKDASDKDDDSSPDDEDASDRKKAKKEKKEKRRKAKLENDGDDDAADASDSKSKKSKKKRKADKEEPATESSTPAASGTSTPSIPMRHLARSRFIAQKRAAVMDQAALNQVSHSNTPLLPERSERSEPPPRQDIG